MTVWGSRTATRDEAHPGARERGHPGGMHDHQNSGAPHVQLGRQRSASRRVVIERGQPIPVAVVDKEPSPPPHPRRPIHHRETK